MKVLLLVAAAAFGTSLPASGQGMDPNMPGMDMSAKPAAKAKPKAKVATKPVARPASKASKPGVAAKPDHMNGMAIPGMTMPASPKTPSDGQTADPHGAHDMAATPGMGMSHAANGAIPEMTMKGHGTGGTSLAAGKAPAPAPPLDHYADRMFPPAEMARARQQLHGEHGGGTFSQVMFNLAEYQVRKGGDGYRWDGQAWFGSDLNRLFLKTEGEGSLTRSVDSSEVQALYSRALDPYWNLQIGARYDFKPNPSRTYATIGIEGLAPGMFDTEAALFLSNKGDVLGRIEGWYDQRLTQRLILQPRVELNLAAQDVCENRVGAGLSNAELGLRLRYEVRREFAPYIGVSYTSKVGSTARYAREDGDGVQATSLVIGVRAWF